MRKVRSSNRVRLRRRCQRSFNTTQSTSERQAALTSHYLNKRGKLGERVVAGILAVTLPLLTIVLTAVTPPASAFDFDGKYVWDYDYTGEAQSFVVPVDGDYLIETWGASGGGAAADNPANGGYSKGTINLQKNTALYLYIGGAGLHGDIGTCVQPSGGWNGGGNGYANCEHWPGGGGGGGTDIRLLPGTWNDIDGLRSRIMVSGGGGGIGNASSIPENTVIGSAGGGLSGDVGTYHTGIYADTGGVAGTQTSGYAFGYGEASIDSGGIYTHNGAGGGGGGYWGGGRGINHDYYSYIAAGGGGGSGFVSGHPGANAIDSFGAPTGQPNHYSGKVFTATQMISGNTAMPAPGGGTETGHMGNGYARITLVKPYIALATTSPDNVVMNITPTASGTAANTVTDLTVATNDLNGYDLKISTSDNRLSCVNYNSGANDTHYINSLTSAGGLVSGQWGYGVGTSGAPPVSWSALPTGSPATLASSSTATSSLSVESGGGITTYVYFGAMLDYSTPICRDSGGNAVPYSGTVVYTASVRSTP